MATTRARQPRTGLRLLKGLSRALLVLLAAVAMAVGGLVVALAALQGFTGDSGAGVRTALFGVPLIVGGAGGIWWLLLRGLSLRSHGSSGFYGGTSSDSGGGWSFGGSDSGGGGGGGDGGGGSC